MSIEAYERVLGNPFLANNSDSLAIVEQTWMSIRISHFPKWSCYAKNRKKRRMRKPEFRKLTSFLIMVAGRSEIYS